MEYLNWLLCSLNVVFKNLGCGVDRCRLSSVVYYCLLGDFRYVSSLGFLVCKMGIIIVSLETCFEDQAKEVTPCRAGMLAKG